MKFNSSIVDRHRIENVVGKSSKKEEMNFNKGAAAKWPMQHHSQLSDQCWWWWCWCDPYGLTTIVRDAFHVGMMKNRKIYCCVFEFLSHFMRRRNFYWYNEAHAVRAKHNVVPWTRCHNGSYTGIVFKLCSAVDAVCRLKNYRRFNLIFRTC